MQAPSVCNSLPSSSHWWAFLIQLTVWMLHPLRQLFLNPHLTVSSGGYSFDHPVLIPLQNWPLSEIIIFLCMFTCSLFIFPHNQKFFRGFCLSFLFMHHQNNAKHVVGTQSLFFKKNFRREQNYVPFDWSNLV